MKLILYCSAILAVVTLGRCASSSEELMALRVKMIKDYISERDAIQSLVEKVEEVCPGYGTKFETALKKAQQCSDSMDDDSETMCTTVKNNLHTCTKPVVEVFEECLPEKAKETPALIVKSFEAVTDYICKTDGEHIFELSNLCVRSQSYRTQRCIRKVRSKLEKYQSNFPSKQELCETMGSVRGCLESHLHFSCGNTKTREAFLNVYDAIASPCKESKESYNEIETFSPSLV